MTDHPPIVDPMVLEAMKRAADPAAPPLLPAPPRPSVDSTMRVRLPHELEGPGSHLAIRALTDWQHNPANEQLSVHAVDGPGPGAASHLYVVSGFAPAGNPSERLLAEPTVPRGIPLLFQNGPIKEAGVNGITQEALLAVLIDRLEGFQRGPYRCHENEGALLHLRAAVRVLNDRTRAREARGVEGTMGA